MTPAFFEKLINTGIDAETPFNTKNKLRVFNSALIVVFLINFFYAVIGICQGFLIAFLMTAAILMMIVATFFLTRAGKHLFSFHFTFWYSFVLLSGFTYLFGGANSSFYFLFFVPVACNILFEQSRVTVFYLLFSSTLLILNVYWSTHVEPYYPVQEWMGTFSYPNLFSVALLIYLGVRMFKAENNRYLSTIVEQRKALEEKNKEITDSINYARKIQTSLIPSEEDFNKYFKESFVLFKPKDIVSGDFYWIVKQDNSIFYVTGDCTGHGVPGGFMTMLGISFLEEIIVEKKITSPAEILNHLRERLIHTLKQSGQAGESKDGMDVVICRLDVNTGTLWYAAANNSLYVVRGKDMMELKPDKQPCGFHHEMLPFSNNEFQLQAGDTIYTLTDGLADQFGGPKGKKYKYKQLEKLILEIQHNNMSDQRNIILRSFDDWKGKLEQIDDVCLIGVKWEG